MLIKLTPYTCTVTKESADKKRYTRGYALPESTFLYDVMNGLKAQNYDLIKKRMYKDGYMVDDLLQYIRTRKLDSQAFCIYNSSWAIYDMGEKFNSIKAGESVILTVEPL